jgi:hypothetical protein
MLEVALLAIICWGTFIGLVLGCALHYRGKRRG